MSLLKLLNDFVVVVIFVGNISAGQIRVYTEHSLKPLIEFKDSTPLQIKYFGFSSLGQSLARFFYDCQEDKAYTESQLISKCQYINTTSSQHMQFKHIQNVPIKRSNQYPIEMPLYIRALSDAHILITSENSDSSKRNGYELG